MRKTPARPALRGKTPGNRLPSPFTFNTAPSIVFGEGKAAEIGALAAARGWTHVLLVTDPGLVTVGLVYPFVASLPAAGIAVAIFPEVAAHPPEAVVAVSYTARTLPTLTPA